MSKRKISIGIILAMLLGLISPVSTWNQELMAEENQPDAGQQCEIWDGTVDTTWYDQDPDQKEYSIYNASQLAGLAKIVNSGNYLRDKKFVLKNDIYLNDNWEEYALWETQPPANGWTPIGTRDYPFQGTFDGEEHTIYGLYIDTDADVQGLFGSQGIWNSSEIHNLHIRNAYVKGGSKVGAFVGTAEDEGDGLGILNCSAEQVLIRGAEDGNYVGGIAGYANENWGIQKCHVIGSVQGGNYVGGILGFAELNHNLRLDYMDAEVVGKQYVGGIAGKITDDLGTDCCYSQGKVSGEEYVGGIFGGLISKRVCLVSCYTATQVLGKGKKGRILGQYQKASYDTIEVYYPENETESAECFDVGCDENGNEYRWNQFSGLEVSEEYLSDGEFCHEKQTIYGIRLGKDKYPSFLDAENKVLKVTYQYENGAILQEKYYNYKSKLEELQPEQPSGQSLRWFVYANGKKTDVEWDFEKDEVISDTTLIPQRETPTPTETPVPTLAPVETLVPTGTPTLAPTETLVPTGTPTLAPEETLKPTEKPTPTPTGTPVSTLAPTETLVPTGTPTLEPEETLKPTEVSTATPAEEPSQKPEDTVKATPKLTETPPKKTVGEGTKFTKNRIQYQVLMVKGKKGTVEVGGVKSKVAKKIVIPQKVSYGGRKYTVVSIADKAFAGNKKINKVILGTGIEKIGAKAFYETSHLQFVDIRTKKLEKVGKKAFVGIHPFAKIKVPRAKKKAYIKLLANKYG